MSLPDAAESPPAASITPFDFLDNYIGRYAAGSETRLQRLAFIAQHSSDETTKQTALSMLERQLKESSNIVRYNQVFGENPDTEWIRTATANNEASLEVLEARLSQAQANLNKDAIRTCFQSLAEYHLQVGQVREALRHTLRSRDYCTNRTQTSHVCWKVIELAMNTSNYNQVREYVAKAEHAIVAGDSDFAVKLKVAAGLALLGEGQYKEACQKFEKVKVPPEDMTTVCSPEDVALYSSLLALATMDRTDLVRYLEEQPTVLELVPAVRDALRMYVRAEYKTCGEILQTLGLELDLVLAPHASKLVERIRNRSHVDYLQPYVKVHLPHMASVFGETTEHLTKSLAQLIGKGILAHARIDCRTQTLQRGNGETRLQKTEKRVQQLQESVLNDAYASMVRLACLEHEQPTERGSYYAPEQDMLAGMGDSDDDVDMVYDSAANPEDAF